jgi:hypothetical protein
MAGELKIKGKFYPLNHKEVLSVAHANLTRFEIIVLYYIRTLDPYSNGIEINASQIAKDLSTEEKTVCRQTVSRALKKLEREGYIDLEILRAIVKLSGKGVLVSDNTDGACTHQGEPTDTKENLQAPQRTSTHQGEPVDTTDIYIDRARAKDSSDSSNCSDLHTQEKKATEEASVSACEKKSSDIRPEEEDQAVAVEVEIVTETEEEIQAKPHSSVEKEKSEIQARNSNPGEELIAAPARDNNPVLQRLIEAVESGKVTKLPPHELKKLADYRLGDILPIYRKSGNINSSNPNDINPDFLEYVRQNHFSNQVRNTGNAAGRIKNLEENPQRWPQLKAFVEGWLEKQKRSTYEERTQTPREKREKNDAFLEKFIKAKTY